MILTKTTQMNLAKLMTAVKNFFSSIAAIGNDDYEMYVLEKEMKPGSRHICGNNRVHHNPYSGVFSA